MKTPVLREYNLVYVFSRDAYPGLLKIGKTSLKAYQLSDITPQQMIEAYNARFRAAGTLAITDMHIRHVEVATFYSEEDQQEMNFFDDDVHEVLLNSHFEQVPIQTPFGLAEEWFRIELPYAIAAIRAVKEGRSMIENPDLLSFTRPDIRFRQEQLESIQLTRSHFAWGQKFLWNAKMRFGKTLCALEVVRQQGYKKTLILTHRPTVRSGWYEDFHNLPFENYLYGSKDGKPENSCSAWVEMVDGKPVNRYDIEGQDFETLFKSDSPYIYFASMQDLRGSKYIFGTNEKNDKGKQRGFEKNDKVFENEWDLIILDEAHEGTQTELGKRVINKLMEGKEPKLLYLSGTPYNILSKFEDNEIFTWDYVREQKAKEEWDYSKGKNPYEGLAQMHVYTYDLNEVYSENHKTYTEDDFFSFSEFFRVYKAGEIIDGKKVDESLDGKFVHENDVRHFLDLLCDKTQENYYPFSSDALCDVLKHTFWLVPGVKQAAALEKLINNHELHTHMGFHVINVAGSGKSMAEMESINDIDEGYAAEIKKAEKGEKDALAKVKKDIGRYGKTITLSCGRLTTGVSIPEWTGVFMLAGGYKTGAAAYMQTIFRCQTPFKNGDIKRDCYAFDFAPDRTLTVVDEYVKMQPGSRRRQFNNPLPDQQREKDITTADLEATIKYLPVIAMKGGREVEYDALSFVTEVNRAYTDYFKEHGLRGRKLTRDFATFSPEDHKLLEAVGKLIGGGKVAFSADGTLVVADNKLTGENPRSPKPPKGPKGSDGTGKDPKPPKQPKQIAESEQRQRSQTVLDQIYVRLPLLIFGAVEEANSVSVEQLLDESVIDARSWEEFMPPRFTKDIFRQIAHLIKVDALIAYAAGIVKEAKAADSLSVENRILSIAQTIARFHFPDKETVLTPWRVVNMHMTKSIGGYNFYNDDYSKVLDKPRFIQNELTGEIIGRKDTCVLEINSKSGVYPLWLAYSIWRYRCDSSGDLSEEEKKSLWADVLKKNVYVLCKTPMAVKITHRALAGYDKSLITHCEYKEGLIETLKDDRKFNKLVKELQSHNFWNIEMGQKLKFNAVVGNPPYQEASDVNNRQNPIYHLFYNLAESLTDIYSIISPARFLFNAGLTPAEWNQKMLNDEHLNVVFYQKNSSDVFPNTDIKGGVAILLRDSTKSYGKIGVFIPNAELSKIAAKFTKSQDVNLPSIVYGGRSDLKFNKTFLTDFPNSPADRLAFIQKKHEKVKKLGPNEEYELKSSTMDALPYAFLDEADIVDRSEYYRILGLKDGNNRVWKYVKRKYLTPRYPSHNNIECYKVFVPKANGSGTLGEPLSKLEIGKPGDSATSTFISIGAFETEIEAINCAKYIKTKFARCLLGICKITQDNPPAVWAYIPLQDFTLESDIDWSQSLDSISKQLYKKYNLEPDNIEFIEKVIKPME